MREAWNMAASPLTTSKENGKDSVRQAVFSAVRNSSQERAPIQSLRPTAKIFQLRFRMKMQMVSVAAAVVIAVGLVLSPSPTQHRADTGTSTIKTVSLADGSSVRLAPGSRLSVIDGFSDEHRRVKLHGDAFFEVTEGSTPFIVETFDTQTTVLGTSFGIRAWPGSMNAATQIVVESGRVSVEHDESSVVLNAGEAAKVDLDELTSPERIDIESALAWRDGGLGYDEELIGNVISDLERRFDIRISAPSSIRLRRVSIWRNEVDDAGEFLGDISATIGVRYRENANGYEMYLN